jgi:hypothetical protein
MRRLVLACVAFLAALVALVFSIRGPEAPTPTPPGAFAFAALGDAPYYPWEELQYRLVLQAIDANELAFVLHVGDIFWRPCTDAHYQKMRDGLDHLRHPVVYTPGDNETYDCWEAGSGGYAPQDRFAAVRRVFFAEPTRSLGGTRMPLESQGGEFVENARWTRGGVVFATTDMIGSRNGTKPFPARTAEDDAAARRRTEAAAAWVRETFAAAAKAGAPAVVIAFHAALAEDRARRPPYEPFLTTLEDEAERFQRPVLVVHGDGHKYRFDHPLRPPNLTRLEVPGSPRVGWVKVFVRADSPEPFTFERHVVPRWKYF